MGDNRDSSSDSRYWGFRARSQYRGQGVLDLVEFRRIQENRSVDQMRDDHAQAKKVWLCRGCCSGRWFLVFALLFGFKIGPAYFEYFSIRQQFRAIATDPAMHAGQRREIESSFYNRSVIETSKAVTRRIWKFQGRRQRGDQRAYSVRVRCLAISAPAWILPVFRQISPAAQNPPGNG